MAVERDQKKIISYLERYGILTTSISLYLLADILPLSFQRAIDDLVKRGVVIKSRGVGRRPIYYLAVSSELTLSQLFPREVA